MTLFTDISYWISVLFGFSLKGRVFQSCALRLAGGLRDKHDVKWIGLVSAWPAGCKCFFLHVQFLEPQIRNR